MPAAKKRKQKSTVFKSVAATPSLTLRPRPNTNWRLPLGHAIEILIVQAERLGISLQRLALELNRYLAMRHQLALPAPKSRLTRREVEIVALMADHLDNQQIADQLVIEISTLKTHLSHIYKKVGNRGQVLVWWEWHRHEYGR